MKQVLFVKGSGTCKKWINMKKMYKHKGEIGKRDEYYLCI